MLKLCYAPLYCLFNVLKLRQPVCYKSVLLVFCCALLQLSSLKTTVVFELQQRHVFLCVYVLVQHGEYVCVCVCVNCRWTSVSLCACVLLVFNPFVFWREWGRGCAMCRETSGEATSVPPQVPPTRSPPPNSYRTCSTPTSESPLGCPLRTQTPQPSEAETDWEGGREREITLKKVKAAAQRSPFWTFTAQGLPPSSLITQCCFM